MIMSNCLVCGLPLGEFESSLNRRWHLDCEKCPICGEGPLDLDMLAKALEMGLPIGHTGCLERRAISDLKDKTIPLRVEQVELLNREMTTQWKVEPNIADIDYLYKMLRSLQETAANVSIILGRTKEKIMVREAQDYRTKTKEQREAEKIETRAVAQKAAQSAERTAQLAAEKADPILKLRRKTIESFVAMGMSAADAEKSVAEIEAKRKGSIQ